MAGTFLELQLKSIGHYIIAHVWPKKVSFFEQSRYVYLGTVRSVRYPFEK